MVYTAEDITVIVIMITDLWLLQSKLYGAKSSGQQHEAEGNNTREGNGRVQERS